MLNTCAIEAVLGELRAVVTDLAKSTDITVSRIVLRSLLTAAIADAEKVERAAESLQMQLSRP